ncbi:MAG: glycoside hydrolase [Gammaproteobacteria bacterium]|nr:glycoside hydrolase [Gammaproteobacteria bacterium]
MRFLAKYLIMAAAISVAFYSPAFAADSHDGTEKSASNPGAPVGQRISVEGRRAISPDITTGPDGSINVICLDKGLTADRPAPKPRKPGEHTHLSSTDLYFTRSEDGGRNWREPVRVNREPGSVWGFAVSKPRIKVGESGTIHIFYPANDRSPVTGLAVIAAHYTRSTDAGKTFEASRKLNSPAPTDQSEMLRDGLGASHSFGTMGLAPDGRIYAFWLDAREMQGPQDGALVYASVSRDDGESFAGERLVMQGEACPCCQMTAAFGEDSSVYLGYRHIYADGRDSTVARSQDGGQSFATRTRLPFKPWDIDACPLKPTAMAVDNERVYAAAYTAGEEPSGIYFIRSSDGGKTFTGRLQIHPEAAVADAPQLAVTANGGVQLVWHAKTDGPRRLFVSISEDAGQTFSPPEELPTPPGSSAYPATAVASDGRPLVVWQQEGEEIYIAAHPGAG